MDKERVKEMSRFVVVGILATAIHYAIYYVLLPYMSHNAAFTSVSRAKTLTASAQTGKLRPREGWGGGELAQHGAGRSSQPFCKVSAYRSELARWPGLHSPHDSPCQLPAFVLGHRQLALDRKSVV